jgi:hypothetical protein
MTRSLREAMKNVGSNLDDESAAHVLPAVNAVVDELLLNFGELRQLVESPG